MHGVQVGPVSMHYEIINCTMIKLSLLLLQLNLVGEGG